jgi:hypothetical protein
MLPIPCDFGLVTVSPFKKYTFREKLTRPSRDGKKNAKANETVYLRSIEPSKSPNS